MRNLNDRIPGAKNFKYKEYVYSQTAMRLGIDNIPKYEITWLNIERVAVNVAQPIREEFGRIRILSGYRSYLLNIKIGGSQYSNHCLGEAIDIEPIEPGVSLLQIMNFIQDNLIWRWMIAEYFPDGWIHIDFRRKSNIQKVKLKDHLHHDHETV